MSIEDINQFIIANQPLVVVVGIPLFSTAAALLGSVLVHRSKKLEIRLNGRLKLADMRKQSLEILLLDIDELRSLMGGLFGHRLQPRSEEWSLSIDDVTRVAGQIDKIGVRLRASKAHLEELRSEASTCLAFLTSCKTPSFDRQYLVKLGEVTSKIVAEEWQQTERELKNLA